MAKFGTCEDCGKDAYLDIHHKDRNHSNNTPNNLKLLCKRCHGLEHGHEGTFAKEKTSPDLCDCIASHQYRNRLQAGFALLSEDELDSGF